MYSLFINIRRNQEPKEEILDKHIKFLSMMRFSRPSILIKKYSRSYTIRDKILEMYKFE